MLKRRQGVQANQTHFYLSNQINSSGWIFEAERLPIFWSLCNWNVFLLYSTYQFDLTFDHLLWLREETTWAYHITLSFTFTSVSFLVPNWICVLRRWDKIAYKPSLRIKRLNSVLSLVLSLLHSLLASPLPLFDCSLFTPLCSSCSFHHLLSPFFRIHLLIPVRFQKQTLITFFLISPANTCK